MFAINEICQEGRDMLFFAKVDDESDNKRIKQLVKMLAPYFLINTINTKDTLFLRDAFITSIDERWLFNSLSDNIPKQPGTDDVPLSEIIREHIRIQAHIKQTSGSSLASYNFAGATILPSGTVLDAYHGHLAPFSLHAGRQSLAATFSDPIRLEQLPIPGGNIIPLTKSDGSQIIIAGINSDILWQSTRKTVRDLKALDSYWSSLGWQRDQNLFFIPQSSYHIDLDIAVPKPGVVIINSYEKILKTPSLLETILKATQRIYPSDYEGGNSDNLIDLGSLKYIFERQQQCLNKVAEFLQSKGFEIIRTLGNLAFSTYVTDKEKIEPCRVATMANLRIFNFINGLPKRCNTGQYEFFSLGTYPDFELFQREFSTALQEKNINCHFLNDGEDGRKSYISESIFENFAAGLRCLTLVTPNMSLNAAVKLPSASAATACNNPRCSNPGPLRCARCKIVFYCSQECQKAHWKIHKPACQQASMQARSSDRPLF